jgi:hypothetical protein
MNRKFIVAILLVVAVPVYAQAQNPRVSKGDAEKVGTIISGDKIKTQAYCDIQKLAEQVAEANEKKDSEKVNQLFDKIETLEKSLGPEYVALINGVQDIAENDELRAEFLFGIWSTRQAVYEVSLRKSEELGCATFTSEVIHASPALADLSRLHLGCVRTKRATGQG